MMDCNWLVKVAIADRQALRGYGVAAADVNAMDHSEVIAELRNRGYSWKRKQKPVRAEVEHAV